MMLLDSNIVIYAAQPENAFIRDMMLDRSVSVSVITKLGVLGYHRLTSAEQDMFQGVFDVIHQIPVTPPIIELAIALRHQRKMGLADSLIAATALKQAVPLLTRNISDFAWIQNLDVINPFDDQAVESEAPA